MRGGGRGGMPPAAAPARRQRRRGPAAAAAALLLLLPHAAAAAQPPVKLHGQCVVQDQIGAVVTGALCSPGKEVEPGTVCTWKQKPGYKCVFIGPVTCSQDGSGWWNDDSDWQTQCHPNRCSGGPRGDTDSNANYQSCIDFGVTDTKCNPTCKSGFHLRHPSPTDPDDFNLVCDKDGTFAGSGDPPIGRSNQMCVADLCFRGPNHNADARGKYDACNALRSGATCAPSCATGYHAYGKIELRCIQGGSNAGYDAAGASCNPNHCEDGPKPGTDDPHTNYSSCLSKHTGEVCNPECVTGYSPSGSAGFQLMCISVAEKKITGSFDAGEFECTPEACSGGPRSSTKEEGTETDYASCTLKHTGDVCSPVCRSRGYTVKGDSFKLLCVADHTFSASGAVCVAGACDKGPKPGTPIPGVDYAKCNAYHSGDLCPATCMAGYHFPSPFKLVCVDRQYDASAATCQPNSCTGGPSAYVQSAPPSAPSFEACDALVTGKQCEPVCAHGLKLRGGHAFSLSCGHDHKYTVPGLTECVFICTAPGKDADPHADYSSCNGETTGSKCSPACADGWESTGSFVLECGPAGGGLLKGQYNTSKSRCFASDCTGGPRGKRDELASFADCSTDLHTGDTCHPWCPSGYVSQPKSLSMLCSKHGDDKNNKYDAHTISCQPLPCTGGPAKNVDPVATYEKCRDLVSGQKCEITCPRGSHGNHPLDLVCEDDQFNAAYSDGVMCVDNQCQPPGTTFDGYVFVEPQCRSVRECVNAGMRCHSKGTLRLTKEMVGVQLECPTQLGYFLPTGCAVVACPEHARRDEANSTCKCMPGFSEGKELEWDTDHWAGECAPGGHAAAVVAPPAPAPDDSGIYWGHDIIILLLLCVIGGGVWWVYLRPGSLAEEAQSVARRHKKRVDAYSDAPPASPGHAVPRSPFSADEQQYLVDSEQPRQYGAADTGAGMVTPRQGDTAASSPARALVSTAVAAAAEATGRSAAAPPAARTGSAAPPAESVKNDSIWAY